MLIEQLINLVCFWKYNEEHEKALDVSILRQILQKTLNLDVVYRSCLCSQLFVMR